LIFFGLGAMIGGIFIVRLLGFLLARHPRATLAVLVGLMIGALRATWPWLEPGRRIAPPPADWAAVALAFVVFLTGFLVVRGIDLWVQRTLGPQPLGAER
jgi:putative membrane protein